MNRLVVDTVTKRFGPRLLFRDLSCTVTGGEVMAVTGANGSGKSTLLRIFAGVMTPGKGKVVLEEEGNMVSTEDRPLRTGFVAPYLNVYDGFSARENLEFIAKTRRMTEEYRRIDEILDFVGLGRRANDRVSTYSSGMKQRVKYAAALLVDPVMLLLDEPSTNLDEVGIAMVKSVIEQQQSRRKIVVLATNSAQEREWCTASIRIEDFR